MATAWKTIAKVNSQSLLPGDSVLFRRGDVWNESLAPASSGSSGNPITFDAYGTGEAPNLTGYYAAPSPGWVFVSGNAWKTALPAGFSTVNFCLFGSVWGQKVGASTANLQGQWDFYFANGFLYVYSVGNPASFYGAAIVPMALSNTPVIHVNGKSWLTFQHFLINWFDQYGVYVHGASDHLVFANMESDSMIPQGTQPLGLYVNETSPGPGDIRIYNFDAHLNYDGFKFDGAAIAITMINDRAYASRDGGLVDNTGAVTYSNCHFYGSSLAVASSTDVEWTTGTGPTAGAGNVAADTDPVVQAFQRYPAMVSLTVDDAGMTAGADAYYNDPVLTAADAAGVPVGVAVTVGYPLANALAPTFQAWVDAGRDVVSHSVSHTYYTNTDALEIQYTGSGSAATLSISNKVLTINVTGASDSVSYNLAQGQAQGTIKGLREALVATGKFTAREQATCQGPYGTGCSAYTESALLAQDLADVTAQDVKTAEYHVLLDVTRLTTDEITLSRQWMTSHLTGLPSTAVYVYPGGYETASMQATAAGVYDGARGALKEDLGVKDTYASGFDVQNITSFGVNPVWQGLTAADLQSRLRAMAWKQQVWGVPWGIFWHSGELSGGEVTNLIEGLKSAGATIRTNTQLVEWLKTGTLETGSAGTYYYKIPAQSTAVDFRPTAASPVVGAGQNLGAAYAIDLDGVNQNGYGAWEIGAHAYIGYSIYGTGGGSYFSVGGGDAYTAAQDAMIDTPLPAPAGIGTGFSGAAAVNVTDTSLGSGRYCRATDGNWLTASGSLRGKQFSFGTGGSAEARGFSLDHALGYIVDDGGLGEPFQFLGFGGTGLCAKRLYASNPSHASTGGLRIGGLEFSPSNARWLYAKSGNPATEIDLYDLSNYADPAGTPAVIPVADFTNCFTPGYVSGGTAGHITYSAFSAPVDDHTPLAVAAAFFSNNTGGQNTGYLLCTVVMNIPAIAAGTASVTSNTYYTYDFQVGQAYVTRYSGGTWVQTALGGIVGDHIALHNARLTRGGACLSPVRVLLTRGQCTGSCSATYYNLDAVGGLSLLPMNGATGHEAQGCAMEIGANGGQAWAYGTANPAGVHVSDINPSTGMLPFCSGVYPNIANAPCHMYMDAHLNWDMNQDGSDTALFGVTTAGVGTDSTMPPPNVEVGVGPWRNEIFGVKPQSAGRAVYRWGHTFNSTTEKSFSGQNAIGVLSPDGAVVGYSTDWYGAFGKADSTGTDSCVGAVDYFRWNTTYGANVNLMPASNVVNPGNYIFNTGAGGTSGGSDPAWNQAVGGTTASGTMVLTNAGASTCRTDAVIVETKLAASTVQTIPASFFGLHFKSGTPWPQIPFGSLRLWDSGTRWQQTETGEDVYDFSVLDTYLALAKSHGLKEILLTVSGTPQWASSDPTNTNCDYASTAPGSCAPPTDLNADGTGTNQYWREYVYDLASHVAELNPASYAVVKDFGMWNEFTRNTESWTGTHAQMVRMVEDAKCILTGRGKITATGELCTAANMHVGAVGLAPAATMLGTPDSVMTAPEKNSFQSYLQTNGAVAAADAIAVHGYVQNGTCCAAAETLVARMAGLRALLPAAASGMPIWSTEGGWGTSSPNLTDPDMQAAFVARYYLVGWAQGFSRLYWYAYDNRTWGTLWNANGVNGCSDGGSGLGCLTKAGAAFGQVYGWMVGNRMSTPCASVGTVWTCGFIKADGAAALAVWDTAQSCAAGSCTYSSYAVEARYASYRGLDGTGHSVVGGSVLIGAQPVLLE